MCRNMDFYVSQKIPGKITENPRTRRDPEPEVGPEDSQGAPGALLARPHPWPRREAAWVGPPHSGALPRPLFIPVERKPQNRSRFPSFRRGAATTLCSSLGGLIWRLFRPPVRGDHRHYHHHHHQSIIPP